MSRSVTNPRRAEGGREAESLERAKLRGRMLLRQRDRAVTVEDYERLAVQSSSGIARACCVQPTARHTIPDSGAIPPGVVKVLLIPRLAQEKKSSSDRLPGSRARSQKRGSLSGRTPPAYRRSCDRGARLRLCVHRGNHSRRANADSDRVARNIRSRLKPLFIRLREDPGRRLALLPHAHDRRHLRTDPGCGRCRFPSGTSSFLCRG